MNITKNYHEHDQPLDLKPLIQYKNLDNYNNKALYDPK